MVGNFRTSSLGDSISVTLRELFWRGAGAGEVVGVGWAIQKLAIRGR